MLDNPWGPGVSHIKQARCQPVLDCIYRLVFSTFNNRNTIQLTNKTTSSDNFDDICKVFLDVISDNAESLVLYRNNCDINTYNTTKMRYYIVKYMSDAFTLQ